MADRLRPLARRFALSDRALRQLSTLVEEVVSDPHSPTSLRQPDQVLDDHLADSLVALELPALPQTGNLVDLGAGAGFPGLVLAIARPGLQAVLLEASARKCAFMERTIDRCAVANAQVVHRRAEAWPEGIGRFDLATARAVGRLEVVLEYGAPLLRVGGSVIAWRGRREAEAEARAASAARELGLQLEEVVRVTPYPGAAHRHLHQATKVAETPGRFPRRPGMATKRPLGAALRGPSDREHR